MSFAVVCGIWFLFSIFILFALADDSHKTTGEIDDVTKS